MAEEQAVNEQTEELNEAVEGVAGEESPASLLEKLKQPKMMIFLGVGLLVLIGLIAAAVIIFSSDDLDMSFSKKKIVVPPAAMVNPDVTEKLTPQRSIAPPYSLDDIETREEPKPVEEEEGEEKADATPESNGAGPVFHKFEPFVVNVIDKSSIHYLKLEMVAEVESEAISEKIKEYRPVLRDALLFLVSDMALSEIVTPGGKSLLKEDIKSVFNKKMKKEYIKTLFFTEFTIQ